MIRDLDLDLVEEVRQPWQFYRDRRPEAYGRPGEAVTTADHAAGTLVAAVSASRRRTS